MIGYVAKEFAATAVATPAQPLPSSSYIKAIVMLSNPGPSYSSGTIRFKSPVSPSFLISSGRILLSLSISSAYGFISFSTNSATISRKSICSSVKLKSIIFLLKFIIEQVQDLQSVLQHNRLLASYIIVYGFHLRFSLA